MGNERKEKEDNENLGTDTSPEQKPDQPGRQFYIPSQIVDEFGEKGRDHLNKPFSAQKMKFMESGVIG